MASAVLGSQNESSWAHMGKNPYSNPHLDSKPNPKKKIKQFHHAASNGAASGRFQENNHFNNLDSPVVTQTASGGAYSFNQTSTSRNSDNYGGYLSSNVAAYSKSELLELRQRLSAELNQIRDLRDRIDSGRFSIVDNPRSLPKLKKLNGSNENKRHGPVVGSVSKNPTNGCDNGVLEVINFDGLLMECIKIIAKLLKHKFGYIFKMPVNAAALGLHDYHQIVKRPMDLGTVKTNLAKNIYRTPVDFADDVRLTFSNALLYNPKNDPVNGMAEQLLSKFEELYSPVQDKIDSTLGQRREVESRDFRVDHELQFQDFEELQYTANSVVPSPGRGKKTKDPKSSPVPIAEVLRKPNRMQAHSSASTSSNPPLPPMNQLPLVPEPLLLSPVRAPSVPIVKEQKVGRAYVTGKLPKPKAKEPNKRDMSMEEKQKLGMGLQSLPQEKMPQLVQIIKKKNQHLAQDGDEIELDIEALDNETLWELDRFVTNWKKLVSKSKRQVLMHNPQAVEVAPPAGHLPASPIADADKGGDDKTGDDFGKKLKDNNDEDVDIDDDLPAASFPPVEIEKDEGPAVGGDQNHDKVQINIQDRVDRGNASSSSSSSGSASSDSSSSGDSDSGSSSGSDSDADDAQS